jgi:glycosyltransferase involved in cell wall biosynthesis
MSQKGLKNWKFVIATSIKKENEKEFEQLQQQAKGFPIEFFINKNNKELWNMYNKAKIYWHASGFGEDLRKNPEYAEHFGISTVEAMGAGCVPVVINAGGQKEIVTENVNGLLWNSENELMDKTNKLIKDEKLLDKLSQEAIVAAQKFSKENFCENLYKLL